MATRVIVATAVVAVAIAVVAATTPSAAAQPVAKLVNVVKSGDAVPGHSPREFRFFFIPFINDAGQIVFKTQFDNFTESIWRVSGGTLEEVATIGGSAPGGGTWSSFVGHPSINASGQVAFRAIISTSPGSGIWRGTPGSLSRIVAEGDTARDEAGTSLGGTFQSFGGTQNLPSDKVLLNSNGNIAFAASVEHTPEDFIGAWMTISGTPLSLINSLETYTLPWGSSTANAAFSFDINSSNTAVTATNYHTANPPVWGTGGIRRGVPGSMSVLVAAGQAAPGVPQPGSTWHSINGSLINENDRVSTCGGLGSSQTCQELAVTLHDAALAQSNTVAPGTGGVNYYDTCGHVPIGLPYAALNASNEVVFAQLLDNDVVLEGEDTGVWYGTPGNIKLFAREGSAVQCERSGTYDDLRIQGNPIWSTQWINENGQFVVLARELEDSNQLDVIVAGETRHHRTYTIVRDGDTVENPAGTVTYGTVIDLNIGYGDGLRDNAISGYGVINACSITCMWLKFDDKDNSEGIFTRRLLPADLNGDGVVNVLDFTLFQGAFAGGNLCLADCDGSGALNVSDFVCFQSAAAAYPSECPEK